MKNYTMKNCPNIYTNNSLNESCLEHFLILNGVFELGEPTDQMLDQVWPGPALLSQCFVSTFIIHGSPFVQGLDCDLHGSKSHAELICVNPRPTMAPTQ